MSAKSWVHHWYDNGAEDQYNNRFEPFFLKGPEEKCCEVNRHVLGGYGVGAGPYTLAWWDEFVTECASSLAVIPNIMKIPLLELVCKATTRTARCPRCGPIASDKLVEFFNMSQQDLYNMSSVRYLFARRCLDDNDVSVEDQNAPVDKTCASLSDVLSVQRSLSLSMQLIAIRTASPFAHNVT